MVNACKSHYEQLHSASRNILDESFSGANEEKLSRCHAFIDDLARWTQVLGSRPESTVLKVASREYQFAILAVASGHYRAAFSSLRLALELCLGSIQWSANERELREWTLGERDANWSVLSDKDNGVLSRQFLRLFSEGLAEESPTYRSSAVAVYRECSEYVHGNSHTHREIPTQLEFDEKVFSLWIKKCSVVRLVVTFGLTARYIEDLKPAQLRSLEHTIFDNIGHSVAVRAIFGATVENTNV